MWSTYTMEYYSAIGKDEYPTFASTWMELEGIMLSEISQTEKDNDHMVSLPCGTEVQQEKEGKNEGGGKQKGE